MKKILYCFGVSLALLIIFFVVIIYQPADDSPNETETTSLIFPKHTNSTDVENPDYISTDLLLEYREQKGYTSISHSFPGRDKEEKGILSAKGVRNTFSQITGLTLPTWVKPIIGVYSVKKYHQSSTRNFNARTRCYFRVGSEEIEPLVEEITSSWAKIFTGKDVTVRKSQYDKGVSYNRGFDFLEGSSHYSLEEHIEGKQVGIEHRYWLIVDPSTGLVYLSSFRGDEE